MKRHRIGCFVGARFYIDEFSVAKIAVARSVPAGTLKPRLMHARANLRAALKGEDHGRS